MTIKLFSAPESLCSQKVKLVLSEKGLEWESHSLNLLTFENLNPSYMRINPKGVVPTLIHDDRVVVDSARIISYLDEQFPDPKLVPINATQQERMNYWVELQDKFPFRELVYGSAKGIEGQLLRRSLRAKENCLRKLMHSEPELEKLYATKLEDLQQWASTIENASQIDILEEQLTALLLRLEAQLSTTKWLCGDSYSLADVVWTVALSRIEKLTTGRHTDLHGMPSLTRYTSRIKSRPSFEQAIENDMTSLRMLIAGIWKITLGS